ncbi:MAG: phospho-sugar mutase [Opitutales bacterium]
MSIEASLKNAVASGELLESTESFVSEWLGSSSLPQWARSSIEELVTNESWEELNDRFYQQIVFGTGGMRGRTIGRVVSEVEKGTPGPQGTPEHPGVGTNMLNDFNIIKATIGLFRYTQQYLKETGSYGKPSIVIAHDVRHFSRFFCELAASTFVKLGGEAYIFEGPRSTPQLSYTVRKLKASCGVVITASHNPPHDNGFKAYFGDGGQLVSPHAENVVAEVKKVTLDEVAEYLDVDLSGVATLGADVDSAYLEALDDNVLDGDVLEKSKLNVVFTPIHGTGGIMTVPALKRLGVNVTTVAEQDEMHSGFPTVKSPNPENAPALAMAMEKADEIGASVVMATDPDADRMGVAVRNSKGELQLLTGNMIGSLMAEYRILTLIEGGILPEEGTESAALIKTYVTTPLQDAIAKRYGLKCINTLTGFKFIGEKLREYEEEMKAKLLEEEGIAIDYDNTTTGARLELLMDYSTAYVFGGEESYGYLGSDIVRDKDANGACLMFAEVAAWCADQGMTVPEFLDSLYMEYGYYKETLINVVYEGASGAAKIKKILNSYREDTPKSIGDFKVSEFKDFGRADFFDADGKQIPKQDLYVLTLDNGYSYAVRGSGTEPKIKFYVFAREDVPEGGDLEAIKAKTEETLKLVCEAIESDARERAEA